MRRSILVLVSLIIIGCTVLVLWRFEARPSPTIVGWQAYVITVAGDGTPIMRDAVLPNETGFSDPFAVAIGSDGAVYISDAGESNRIRKIEPDKTVTTFAGGAEGYADGQGLQASFNTPSGIAIDSKGNLYVADTGNNRIRKITPDGLVSTVAGDGSAGYLDGPAVSARFDGPIGITVDDRGNIYVADSYNDRIRLITPDGRVSTVAGAGRPGYGDGPASDALFDTPCGVAVTKDGVLIVADTGNNVLRRITPEGDVTTLATVFPVAANPSDLRKPVGVAITHDGFLYVAELERSRVLQIAPDGSAHIIAGAEAENTDAVVGTRFNQASGVAVDKKGDLYVADAANYLVRKLRPAPETANSIHGPAPVLTKESLGEESLLWPLDPQQGPHEVVATMGEVRGNFDSTDARERLHSGIDVFGAYGNLVRAIRSEKVTSPIANWGFDGINEGLRVGVISYIHIHVGRDKDGKVFEDQRFVPVKDEEGKLNRIRVRRGARFRPGDALGTVNRMYHVHLNVGPPGAEINPLSFSPMGFSDQIAPQIEPNGIQLFTESGERVTEKSQGRLIVNGRVRIVVEAFDRNDRNSSRRKLGLYRLGYQVLKVDGATSSEQAASGFEEPRMNIEFNRLPAKRTATKLAFAEQSGITVYGSATTRFLYEVTNKVRDGLASPSIWDTSELPPGDYILRIIAMDYSGNEARENRDVLISIR